MSEKYILTHDMGTSSNKAVLFTTSGSIIGQAQQEYPIFHPRPGWAEQDPNDWLRAVYSTTRELLRTTAVKSDQIEGITLACQMQTLVAVDVHGAPVMPAITWLDTRAADIIMQKLWIQPRIMGYHLPRLLKFLRKTGGAPGHTGKDPIGKILWLAHHQPGLFADTHKFLDAKDFIVYQLTGQLVKSTDMAVVWWLLDTRHNRYQWDEQLCSLAGITPDRLPEVRESYAVVGRLQPEAAAEMGLNPDIPIINGAGDISAAAVGSGALEQGELYIRLGTSGGVAGHFQKRKIDLKHYTGCIGSTYPEKYYLALAHQETLGICLEWMKNKILYHTEQLKQESRDHNLYALLDQLAEQSPPGAAGLMFAPWMLGERSPLDDRYVRAGFYNLSLHHSREHIMRAVLEGIAFNLRWALHTMETLYEPVDQLNIIGGGAKSDIWCQIIADVTNRKINQVEDPQQANARGAAMLASWALGYVDSFEAIKNHIRIKHQFVPNAKNRLLYDRLYQAFKNMYRNTKRWHAHMNASQWLDPEKDNL